MSCQNADNQFVCSERDFQSTSAARLGGDEKSQNAVERMAAIRDNDIADERFGFARRDDAAPTEAFLINLQQVVHIC